MELILHEAKQQIPKLYETKEENNPIKLSTNKQLFQRAKGIFCPAPSGYFDPGCSSPLSLPRSGYDPVRRPRCHRRPGKYTPGFLPVAVTPRSTNCAGSSHS